MGFEIKNRRLVRQLPKLFRNQEANYLFLPHLFYLFLILIPKCSLSDTRFFNYYGLEAEILIARAPLLIMP